ncbi:ThiS family protein [Stieleria bergensis]|uniref:Molybdopterin synthase sulfur carrier subunit n=1 Tax=Stieleria bergensis TaxID=2528025 RepID=A0A517STW5_9BACT|nr:ThiS family protein [Planctomycetes bacterium SV_7m_r]
MSETHAAINVQLFAKFREVAGCDQLQVVLPNGLPCTADQVLKQLAAQLPEVALLIPQCRLAIDDAYVAADHVIDDLNAQFAVIPPVSGG